MTLATKKNGEKMQGFISPGLHRSIDGVKVTVYVQWKSIEDYQKCEIILILFQILNKHWQLPESGMYEVVENFLPLNDKSYRIERGKK